MRAIVSVNDPMSYSPFSMPRFPKVLGVLTLVLIGSLSQFASAQDNDGDASTVVYPAEYFAEYAPITAQNMLDRIPGQGSAGGASFSGGPPGTPSAGGRGLGSGDSGSEILVNGKRTAGKNNQTSGLLESIAADQVREIQIIRGTSGDLDVRGSGQVVNVVLHEELASNSLSYEVSVQSYQDEEIKPGGSAALSGQRGNLNYLFSLSSSPRYSHSIGKEDSISGDFSPNDIVVEKRTRDQNDNALSMNLGYEISANSSARFNALYADRDDPTNVIRNTIDLTTEPNPTISEREDIPGERNNWEIGGDYELTLANGSRFKLLGIANQDNREATRERYLLDDSVDEKNLFINTDSVTEERIARASFTFDVFDGQDIEFGLERAQTTLDSKLALGLPDSSGIPSDSHGGLVPQEVSNANSKVEEIRFEPFIIHNWIINPQMSLESTLVYEFSEITQSGDVSNQRDFEFAKPKVDFRYDLTPSLQMRGTIERIVNQLSFADFVANNDSEDNDETTQAGNAELRQQTQWRYSFNTEYRLPDDAGVLSAEIYYADHEDVIDRVDVSPSEDDLRSANGNIGDGKELAMNLNASIRMGMINMPNLLVTTQLNLQDSEVTDPFLGIERRFQMFHRGRFTFMFRHDIPEWRANWGMQYFDRIDGGMFRYDIDDIEFAVGEPRVNLFAEYIDRRGLTYRLDAGALTDGYQLRRRERFEGRISDNILEEIESRTTTSGLELTFKVTGTF